jgi:ABC-type branched-subunit amino acid transport system substrate-binding protein
VTPLDDADDPTGVEKALAAAYASKADAVVAAPTGRTVEALQARAKRSKTPVLVVGSAGTRHGLDATNPVVALVPWSVEQAIQLSIALQAPCASVQPGLVVEDTARGKELEAALRRNAGPRQTVVGTAWAAPGASPVPAELQALREKRCDRLVVIGEPDLVDRTLDAAASIGWEVPLLGAEGTCSTASAALREGRAKDSWFLDGPPRLLVDAIDRGPKAGTPVLPRVVTAWTAAEVLFDAAAAAKSGRDADLVAAIRAQRYGTEEEEATVLDVTGRASLWRWRLWQPGPRGPETVPGSLLPIEGFGTLLRMRPASAYQAEPGTKVVWLTFGEPKGKPARSIDKDIADLHLGSRGYEGDMDAVVLDELLARAMAKLNRLFLKNEDGTGIPGVSFAISFTAKKPEKLKSSEYWTMLIAGDDPEAGGRAFGDGHCEVYATFLKRTIFLKDALEPPMTQEDKRVTDGTYVQGKPFKLQHLRADQIRCLIDGYAGSFALTGAHEVGHLAGLGHDTTDPRSIMNVVEGAGLRENHALFVPMHAQALERALGRWPAR